MVEAGGVGICERIENTQLAEKKETLETYNHPNLGPTGTYLEHGFLKARSPQNTPTPIIEGALKARQI
jgi:hypothetical protein